MSSPRAAPSTAVGLRACRSTGRRGRRTIDGRGGINRVYGAFSRNQILIFDDLTGLLDDLASYSRELDEMGEATEKIDLKENFHRLESVRYVIGHLRPDRPQATTMNRPPALGGTGLQNL